MKTLTSLFLFFGSILFIQCSDKSKSTEDEGLLEIDKETTGFSPQIESDNIQESGKELEVMNGLYSDREVMVNSNGIYSQMLTSSAYSLAPIDNIESDERSVGYGYNEITGTWCGKCISEAQLAPVDNAIETKISITKVKHFFDLKEQLKFDAQASIRYGLFSSDMSYSKFASKNITKFAQYLLVQAEVKKSPELIKESNFSQLGKDNIKNSYKNFVNSCGTQYIIGRVQGGKLYALVEIVSSSEQEYTSNSATLNASLGTFGSLDASFKSTLERISQNSSLKTTLIKSGGSDEIITDIDKLVQKVTEFTNEVRQNPKTLYLKLQSYNGVQDYPRRFKREQLNWINDQFKVIASFLEKCYSFRSDLIFVKTFPAAFSPTVLTELDSLFKKNELQIKNYLEYASKLQNDFLTKKKLRPRDYELPTPPNILDINFLPGWTLPKKEVYINTIGQSITTTDRHNVECNNRCPCNGGRGWFDRYQGSIRVTNNQYTLVNPRIVCRSGACGWNAPNVQVPGTVWISPDGKTLNWNFCASSVSTFYDIYADEVKYVIVQN